MTNVAISPIPSSTDSPGANKVAAVHDDARVRAFTDLFDRVEDTKEPTWLRKIRRCGIERFGQLGFPTTKNEDWHFTSVAPLTQHSYSLLPSDITQPIDQATLQPFLFDGEWDTFVFVNGTLAPSMSSAFTQTDSYVVTSLENAIASHSETVEQRLNSLADYKNDAFTALNSAFLSNGLFVHAQAKSVVDKHIHILYVTTADAKGAMVSPRHLIIADHQAEITVVESYVSLPGAGPYFTNAVSEVFVEDGAFVREYKIQREDETAGYHVASAYVHQGRSSNYESFSYAVGADLSRTNILTVLDGEGSHATINGLYLVDGTQTVDHQTRIEHVKENCTSHEIYKGVLDGKSHGIFNGKVYVHPEAQKTDGKQSNNNLLLSEHARIDTKPQLEIFADDVRCTHGATIGRLDETSLFYLKSRGLSSDVSRKLLTYAFAAEVLEELTIKSVCDRLESLAFERFDIDAR